MGSQMTVGKRIVVGFAAVILITVLLGGLAISSMMTASTNSNKLSSEYVPEVKVAAEFRGAANRVMYEMRGYGFTENDQYYQNALVELQALEDALQACKDLDARAIYLEQLGGQIEIAQKAVDDYKHYVQATVETTAELASERAELDSNAAIYMEACASFLASQNQAFKKDLAERLEKIGLVDEIVDLGTKTRVLNFKSQATGDKALMEQALTTVQGVAEVASSLRAITVLEDDLTEIDHIENAAANYADSMRTYQLAAAKGESLGEIRSEMDAAAAIYVESCDEYRASQMAALQKDMTERHDKITLANDVIDIGNATRIAAFKSQALRDPEIMLAGIDGLKKLDEKYSGLRDVTRLEQDLKAIDTTEQAGNTYGEAMGQFLTAWQKLQDLGDKRNEAGGVMIAAAKTTADAAMGTTTELSTASTASLTASNRILSIGLLIGVVIAVAAAMIITKSITRPLNAAVNSLSSGSEQVTAAAGQVAQSSQSMAEGASNQASSLEEISASLEEITSMTRQNADSSHEANHIANQAQSDARTGSEAMQRMSAAIDQIKKSSDETAGIVKTIEEIAFQTNLLALNAAVEAARAGDAGKGFAVVAEEVRNLAQRAAEAARNTGDLISESVKNSDNGVNISREVAESLTKIADGSTRVEHITAEVAAASKEQAQGVEQISVAMSQIDQVTQRNAADSEEGAAAAEELNAQAGEMMKVVLDVAKLVGSKQTHVLSGFASFDMDDDSHHRGNGGNHGQSNGKSSNVLDSIPHHILHGRNGSSAKKSSEPVASLTEADMEDF
jgi:methyl-accepting chemotaxis protein